MRRGILRISCFFIAFVISCNDENGDPSCGSSVSEFTGVWNITEHCDSIEYHYQLTISDSAAGMILLNLGDAGSDIALNAALDGNSGFDIQPKVVLGVQVTGNGSLNGGCEQLLIQWFGAKGNCTATGIK